jgi:hypothetical protein
VEISNMAAKAPIRVRIVVLFGHCAGTMAADPQRRMEESRNQPNVSKLNPPDHSLTTVENANRRQITAPRILLDAQRTL